jgi:L-alanine-DL-glutamate epimerase-like enolase superfamily enzyme
MGAVRLSDPLEDAMQVKISRVEWPYAAAFRISSGAHVSAEAVQVELRDGSLVGRGEGHSVFYHDETVDSMLAQLKSVESDLARGISRAELQSLMPAGGARTAVDCALWDFEAKRAGKRAWVLAGMRSVSPITSDFTLSLDTPTAMAASAARVPQYSRLKLKLTGEGDIDRVAAVRAARPDAALIVDANQAWNERQLHEFTPKLAQLGVKLIEQPLPEGGDDALAHFTSPIPLCADESCQTRASLASLGGKYQYVNIKLDKTGGLTEALALAQEAQKLGFKLMVGCMAGSSLSMAPAFIIGQLCDFVDLDGPLLAKTDMPNPIRYDGGSMSAPEPELWG